MDNLDINSLDGSLAYADTLPVFWSPRDDTSPESNYTRISEHNEHVLRCVNLLGEQLKDKIEDESETDQALMRLEAKVNLLLDLVSNLDQRIRQVPNLTQTRLSAAGIEWRCQESAPSVGDSIWVDIYLDNRIPEAMKIAAKVLAVTVEEEGAVVSAMFESMEGGAKDQMEKMIFRHHRRMIAQSKSS
jgi:hypothetical protein